MNDELKQLYRETFDRIIFGIVAIGIIAGLAAFFTQGVESPWFGRSVALVSIAVVAYIVRLVGLLVVAAVILILALSGFTVDVLLQSTAPASVTGYLFIPIIMIAGLLLHPIAGLLVAIGAGVAVSLMTYFTGQLTVESLYTLFPFLGVTLLLGLLVTQSKLNFTRLGEQLVKSRILLKERALQLMQNMKRVEFLEGEVKTLTKQLKEIQAKANRQQTSVSQENGYLYELLQGTIQELHDAATQLERSIESVSVLPDVENHRDVLDAAWQKLHHLRALAVNLEEMSQIDHNGFELDYGTVDVRQLIAEVAGTARGLVRNKKITIHQQVGSDVSTLRADPDRLRQVLLHLLNNAIKYTDQGVVEIRAELDGPELVIFVSDTGIGVPSDEAETLFDRFSRGTSPTARERQGTGLGLAICKRLIQLHKGRMWVTSVFGEGSTFYMALPLYVTQRAVERSRTTTKITQRLQKLTPADLEAAELAAAAQTTAPVKREGERESTIVLPALHSIGKDADGETIIIPRKPAANHVPMSDTTAQAMLRGKDYRSRQMEPIRRFQPTYIRRFGIILLGVLFTIVTAIGLLAVANYTPPSENEAEARAGTSAAAADEAIIPGSDVEPDGLIPTVALDTRPSISIGRSSGGNPTATTPADDQESALLLPTASPTAQAQQPTPTPTASATPVGVSVVSTIEALNEPLPTQANPSPSPTATRLQLPTSTPVVVSISPTPTSSSTPTPTSTVSTGAAIPAAVVQPPATPTLAVPTPLPAEVVFASGQTIVSQLDTDNGAQVELPMLLDSNSRLSWSPSGQLLFTGEQENRRDIFVTDRNATSLVNLTQSAADDFQPDWSPAGDQIAFSSGRTGNFDIFAMAADGSTPVQLTTGRGFEEWPVWSPDGQKIAFVSDRDGNIELYTMDADGSNQQRLTNDPAEDWPATWSPDGQWLAYASNRDAGWNLYVVSTAGGTPQRLTDASGNERDPIWSPDGSTIAFVYDGGGNFDVYTLPVPAGLNSIVPTSAWTQVSDTPTDERFPTWGQAGQ